MTDESKSLMNINNNNTGCLCWICFFIAVVVFCIATDVKSIRDKLMEKPADAKTNGGQTR